MREVIRNHGADLQAVSDGCFGAAAFVGELALSEQEIRDHELARARHALTYLKTRIGNEAMRELLAEDTFAMTCRAREWVERSHGRWQTGSVALVVPGLNAKTFHDWYERAMAQREEAPLRAGHPEHFVLLPGDDSIEVIENVGETDLPWRVFYRALPEDAFPVPWNSEHPVRFGAELVDGGGLRVGYTMHQARDAEDGMHLRLRTILPAAAPRSVVDHHLRHFAIEFTNWSRIARRAHRTDEFTT